MIASSMAADALAAVRGGGLPLVMLDSDPTDAAAAATVNLDIADGVRRTTEHLLALGHRHFAHIAADIDSWTFRVRARALAEALRGTRDGGAHGAAALVVDEGAGRGARAVGAGRAADGLPVRRRPAGGRCLQGGATAGLRVPDEVSVTGFDDLALATAVEPELTTVRLPAEAVGPRG
ncbi:substrate-binding domain-containing protein [Streptomyces sp. M19]